MKRAAIVLGAFLGLFVIAALILPKDFRLEREVVITRSLNETFMKVLFLKNHELWSHYILKDPNIRKSYLGQDGTQGFIAKWSSDDEEVGTGEQEITHIYNEKIVSTQIRLDKPFKTSFESYFKTEPVDRTQTKVIMGMYTKVPIPMNVLSFVFNVCFNQQKKIEKNMDESLARMKNILEK